MYVLLKLDRVMPPTTYNKLKDVRKLLPLEDDEESSQYPIGDRAL